MNSVIASPRAAIAQALDEYLTAPRRKVPGTRMAMNVTDPPRRAALIAYLRTATSK
jgi:cytochrome c